MWNIFMSNSMLLKNFTQRSPDESWVQTHGLQFINALSSMLTVYSYVIFSCSKSPPLKTIEVISRRISGLNCLSMAMCWKDLWRGIINHMHRKPICTGFQ